MDGRIRDDGRVFWRRPARVRQTIEKVVSPDQARGRRCTLTRRVRCTPGLGFGGSSACSAWSVSHPPWLVPARWV